MLASATLRPKLFISHVTTITALPFCGDHGRVPSHPSLLQFWVQFGYDVMIENHSWPNEITTVAPTFVPSSLRSKPKRAYERSVPMGVFFRQGEK